MRIHHVGYLVKNIEKSEKDFLTLGFIAEKKAMYDSIRDVNILFLYNGAYRVELIEPAGKESELYPLLSKYKNAPYHICFITDDLDKTIEELQSRHYLVVQKPETAPCIDHQRVVFLSGPGIELIEILEGSKSASERNTKGDG